MCYPVTQPNKAKVLSQCYQQPITIHFPPTYTEHSIYKSATPYEGVYNVYLDQLLQTQLLSTPNLLYNFCI